MEWPAHPPLVRGGGVTQFPKDLTNISFDNCFGSPSNRVCMISDL